MTTRITKVPSAVALYRVQFAAANNSFLNSGETITSLSVLCSSPGLGIMSVTNTGSEALFYVASGSVKAEYPVDIAFQTNFARGDVVSLMIKIDERKYVERTSAP